MEEVLFTPAAVLGLLTQIEELDNKPISFAESEDGSIHLTIGSTSYTLETDVADEVSVDTEAVQEVASINEEGYQQLEDDGVEFSDAPVEGGIIKELAKTLLIGGLVRLNNKYMSKDQFDAYAQQAKKYRR